MDKPRLLKMDSGLPVFVKALSWLTSKTLLPSTFSWDPGFSLESLFSFS